MILAHLWWQHIGFFIFNLLRNSLLVWFVQISVVLSHFLLLSRLIQYVSVPQVLECWFIDRGHQTSFIRIHVAFFKAWRVIRLLIEVSIRIHINLCFHHLKLVSLHRWGVAHSIAQVLLWVVHTPLIQLLDNVFSAWDRTSACFCQEVMNDSVGGSPSLKTVWISFV